ncbi:MAG: hypothetical protein R3266_00475 [Gemmatimonadota bacterium]|nr:hypothetical protein [Gemmatimonadota bacterium]
MGKGKYVPNVLDRARDELFSHIRRCGVLEADDEQRDEWLDDTLQYFGERYPELTPDELDRLRTIGERYCAPVVPHGDADATTVSARAGASAQGAADAEDESESGEVSAA